MTERISRRNALTGAAILGVAVPTLAACGGDDTPSSSDSTPSTTESTPGSSTPSESATGQAGGDGFASTSDIPVGGGAIFADEEVVVTQPTEGTFNGFSNICTHQGCPMLSVTETINCSCHGSQFSIQDGSNVTGPNGAAAGSVSPLPAVALNVTGSDIAKA